MATKNKKIETRLDPETYAALEDAADNFEESIYSMTQRLICMGLAEFRRPKDIPPKYRAVTLMVDNDIYEVLDKLADKHCGTIPDAVWSCVLDTIERRKLNSV